MKKHLKLYLSLCVIGFGFLLISCNKEYYDMDDIIFSVKTPEIAYIDSTITLKGTINQPLDIKVYFNDLTDENLIGVLKPHTDSISWKPTNIKAGDYLLWLRVDYESKKNQGDAVIHFKNIHIKKAPRIIE